MISSRQSRQSPPGDGALESPQSRHAGRRARPRESQADETSPVARVCCSGGVWKDTRRGKEMSLGGGLSGLSLGGGFISLASFASVGIMLLVGIVVLAGVALSVAVFAAGGLLLSVDIAVSAEAGMSFCFMF